METSFIDKKKLNYNPFKFYQDCYVISYIINNSSGCIFDIFKYFIISLYKRKTKHFNRNKT